MNFLYANLYQRVLEWHLINQNEQSLKSQGPTELTNIGPIAHLNTYPLQQ